MSIVNQFDWDWYLWDQATLMAQPGESSDLPLGAPAEFAFT
jgi:hypothetical protein